MICIIIYITYNASASCWDLAATVFCTVHDIPEHPWLLIHSRLCIAEEQGVPIFLPFYSDRDHLCHCPTGELSGTETVPFQSLICSVPLQLSTPWLWEWTKGSFWKPFHSTWLRRHKGTGVSQCQGQDQRLHCLFGDKKKRGHLNAGLAQ